MNGIQVLLKSFWLMTSDISLSFYFLKNDYQIDGTKGKEERLAAATQLCVLKHGEWKLLPNQISECRLNSNGFVENKNFTNSRYIFSLFHHLNMFTQNYTASPLLECGLHTMTSFRRIQYGTQGERRPVASAEKPHTHHLSQMTMVSMKTQESCWQCTPLMWYDKHSILHPRLPPQNPKPQSGHRKNIRQIPKEGHSTRYLISSPQNGQGHKGKKEVPRGT